jgi:DNA-binding NtrC family response regulator
MTKPLILIIDDNNFIRMQINKFLKDGDFETLEATNGDEGLKIFGDKVNEISCVLVDVRMEPIDGFDFLKKIRAEDNSVPAILITGDQNADILSKASQYNVAGVLMKPIDKDRLLQMVTRITQRSSRKS